MACVDNVYIPFITPNVDDEYGDYSDEDYKDYDECKGGSNSIKELDNYTMSIHDKFKEMKDISKNDNWKHAKHCCPDHSYVFQDLCEVHLRRFTEMFIQTLNQSHPQQMSNKLPYIVSYPPDLGQWQ